jgi:hypothetical protein
MVDQADPPDPKETESDLTQREFGRGDECDFTAEDLDLADAFWDAMGRAEQAAKSGRTSAPQTDELERQRERDNLSQDV